MHSVLRLLPPLAVTAALGACTVAPPPGPTVMTTPGKGKTYDAYRIDDGRCRQDAAAANNGVTPQQGANSSGVGSAAVGTVVGAGIGALLGAAAGNPGLGAAAGAGGGLLVGSSVGAGNAAESANALQGNYDRVYAQCMIASGEQVEAPQVAYAPPPAPVVVAAPPVYAYPPPPYAYGPYYGGGWGYGYHGGW
ncbi:glycine zipper family protein [Lichenicoccus roseus]|uniref:Glycine zipper family protein n=1 Tax=Lichenicoccus roseus TaxID=2683649 RepID=A0A5R9J5T2_9PROT|nr:glycine zipper family protein [Lichenicoccus roseus]TLU72922.1 glycine zipper family protein [Lichenicoccus roseus]